MSYRRRAYDDAATSSEMASDCRAVEEALQLPQRPTEDDRVARAAARPSPRVLSEDSPSEVRTPNVSVSDEAARLGSALHLHLD